MVENKETDDLNAAFVAYLREAEGEEVEVSPTEPSAAPDAKPKAHRAFDIARLWAFARREMMELLRDRMRLTFAFLGPIILMLTFGYGISLDVQNLPYAALDRDQTAESRALLEAFSGSRYFDEQAPATDTATLNARMRSGELAVAIEVPPGFGRSLLLDQRPEVQVSVDGAMPFRAETTRGYIQGLALSYLADQTERIYGRRIDLTPVNVETRFRYNQAFKSVSAMVPSVIMLMLVLIPAMMAAMGVVREKETGSIANFRSTPVTRTEFILGKQLPYVVIALVSFVTLIVVSYAIFSVPIKGSVTALLFGTLLYVLATTGFGVLISAFTNTQVAATFAAAIISIIPAVNFSGMLVPVSSLSGGGRLIGLGFPSAWYQQISVGTFTKGLGLETLWHNHAVLAVFAVLFVALSIVALRKQEK
jgi:ribosome-dependent ATPase